MLPEKVKITDEQAQAMVEARVAFMNHCPFFCYYYYDQLEEYPTRYFPMAATDSKRVFFHPEWLTSLRPPERCFVLAHEVYHAVWGHSKRVKYYLQEGMIEGLPFIPKLFNLAADYVINADLIDQKIGLCNPGWLFRPDIKGTDKIEEVYKKLYKEMKKKPPGPGEPGDMPGQPGDQPGKPGDQPGTTGSNRGYGKGSQPDKKAIDNDHAFDEVTPPHVDPVTAEPDEIDEITHKEAVARAASAAKAMGKMPAGLQRIVDEILAPQVNWREHVRMVITGRVGNRRETWLRPNRRRLVLNPLVYMPGKRGNGAELVAVWIDNSGSISRGEYKAFFSEVGGVLTDVKPKRLLVGWCDCRVQRTEWATTLEEWQDLLVSPTPGGGGTSFIPPFEWMKEQDVVPETVIYLTDMMGTFPVKPDFPVIWCATTDHAAPFGEVVHITV